MQTKSCSKCLLDLPLDAFYKAKRGKFGVMSKCKSCKAQYESSYYKNNHEARKKRSIRELERSRLKRYQLSSSEFKSLLEVQYNCCAICTIDITNSIQNVDHCHFTGKVRGILCTNCNTGLGKLGDTEDSLLKALQYLRKYN
jgi:hypothetical protein